MPRIDQLETRIKAVYDHWASLPDDKRRKKINLILPFIQIVSYLDFIKQGTGPEAGMLQHFNGEYERFFGQDLSQTAVSDIPEALRLAVERAQKPGQAKLSEREVDELLGYQKKYIHAHSRCLFNYGKFLDAVTKATRSNPGELTEIEAALQEVRKAEDDKSLMAGLIKLNALCQLEKYSAVLVKDDLENHALLNQMSNYLQHIAQLPALLLDDASFAKIHESLEAEPTKKRMHRDVPDASSLKKTSEELAERGFEFQVGIETEELLHSVDEEKEPRSPYQKVAALKGILADLNARRKMQSKYGLAANPGEVKDLMSAIAALPDFPMPNIATAFPSDAEKALAISTSDFLFITRSIEEFLSKQDRVAGGRDSGLPSSPTSPAVDKERSQYIRNLVACFTPQEAAFYKMFLTDDLPEKCKIDMDGVYDPKKSKDENFAVIWPLIKQGRFHESLLDMIQAHEVSVGPHDVSDIVGKKSEALRGMQLNANLSGLSFDDPNVQLNMSFWLKVDGQKKCILTPEVVKEGGETKMQINALGVHILQIIQDAVAGAAGIQGVLRNQDEINSAYDRKKYLSTQLEGTDYFRVDPNEPAFLNHKRLAAKTATVRCSVVDPGCKIGVAEIRLIGNNPHFAIFDQDEENVFRSGLEFIPETLLPMIADKVNEFVKGKTDAELAALYNTKVALNHDGTVVGLTPTKVVGPINRDVAASVDGREAHDPQAPRKSVAMVAVPGTETHREEHDYRDGAPFGAKRLVPVSHEHIPGTHS